MELKGLKKNVKNRISIKTILLVIGIIPFIIMIYVGIKAMFVGSEGFVCFGNCPLIYGFEAFLVRNSFIFNKVFFLYTNIAILFYICFILYTRMDTDKKKE